MRTHGGPAQVVEGRPATLADLAGVEEDLTAGAMQADVVATNQFPLQLRLLQARACLFRAAAASAGMGLQQGRQAEEEADAASSPAIWVCPPLTWRWFHCCCCCWRCAAGQRGGQVGPAAGGEGGG